MRSPFPHEVPPRSAQRYCALSSHLKYLTPLPRTGRNVSVFFLRQTPHEGGNTVVSVLYTLV